MKKKRILIGVVVSILLIALDQFTKSLAVSCLKGKEPVKLLGDIFELYYLENQGAAFGIMQQKQVFFYVLTVILSVLIVWVYLRIPEGKRFRPMQWTMIGLFSGAIGNFIDRVSQQYVVDFIYFKPINFPVFNVADIFVTCSMALFIVLILFVYKEEETAFLWPSKKEKKDE